MKWFWFLCIGFLSCGQKSSPAGQENQDSSFRANNGNKSTDTANKTLTPVNASQLIVPGEGIGKIWLGTEASNLGALLGPPAMSDAAMGKAWLTWKGKRDEHNNAAELNVFTAYKDDSLQQKTVQQIRTTSPAFSTAGGLHVYSTLEAIRAEFPGMKKRAQYNEDGRDIVIYDAQQEGIAFELATANEQQICTGILIYPKGKDVTHWYRLLHPGMQLY